MGTNTCSSDSIHVPAGSSGCAHLLDAVGRAGEPEVLDVGIVAEPVQCEEQEVRQDLNEKCTGLAQNLQACPAFD
jgi:hypothetical protein